MTGIRSLRARLSLALAGVVVIALVVVWAIVVPPLERNLVNAKLDQLEAVAQRVRVPIDAPDIAQRVERAAELADARVYVLAPDFGVPPPLRVVEYSRRQQPAETGIATDPVAARASRSGERERGRVSRDNATFAEVAVPRGEPDADGFRTVVLFVAPLEDTLANVRSVERRVLAAGGVALLVALLIGSAAASVFARRLRRLERAADRIAGGDLEQPVVDGGSDEVAQLASAFEHMRRRLAQLEHARREFVANASHELRTPIFSLSGFLELLASEDLDEATRREFLASMQEQVERLTSLAAELLDLSRLDAGQLRVQREAVDLAAIGEVLADEFGAVARSSGHTLEIELRPPLADARADGERVLQIGRALTENALRHTPAGTRVVIRAAEEDGSPALSVRDDGPGIAAEHADQVFERFYRVDGARASGTGLGLAIARELAELMEGRLELRTLGRGTEFSLRLPPAPAEAAERPGERARATR